MTHTLHPRPGANVCLLDWLTHTLGAMPDVQRLLLFGSFARGEADDWSDIDLLAVVTHRSQFAHVFGALATQKRILYRSTFSPAVEPSGGRVLGIVFAGESVFHSVDLNFMTTAETQLPNALDRFGRMRELSTLPEVGIRVDVPEMFMAEVEPPDEKRVADGLHFVKKHVKKILRGSGRDSTAELALWLPRLRETLVAYQREPSNPRGDIVRVAEAYYQAGMALVDG